MSIWWSYLNYKIYLYYTRKKEGGPILSAWLASSLLLTINFMTLFGLVDYILDQKLINRGDELLYGILFIIIGSSISFLLTYSGKRYRNYFAEFEMNRKFYKKWDWSIKLYFIFTAIVFFTILLLFDFRHNDYF